MNKVGLFTTGCVLILLTLPYCGGRIYKTIIFDIHCEGHLKRAADANTIHLAAKELQIAVDYMEDNKLIGGYTSVIYRTPDEDVGFWYDNITSALIELNSVNEDATQLERSNLLMKLRETLLDDSKAGYDVTSPAGIEVFPYNKLLSIYGVFCFIVSIISFSMPYVWYIELE